MSTRITQSMLSSAFLSDLDSISTRYAETQRKLSSGKELQKPSDDPFAVSRALQLRDELGANAQYQRNVQDAQGWQAATDTALAQVGDLGLRARDLVVQGANGSTSASARASIAAEIHQIVDSIKSAANTQYGDSYVLSGSATSTAPFDFTSDGYQGNSDALAREIGEGVAVNVNTTGDSSVEGLIASLRQAETDLSANDTSALGGADLRALDTSQTQLTVDRASTGALGNRLDTALARLQQLQESATQLLSNTEDADMAQTMVDLSQQQAVYQAALKAGAQLIQPSLIDYLR